jgi:hypothetical protein
MQEELTTRRPVATVDHATEAVGELVRFPVTANVSHGSPLRSGQKTTGAGRNRCREHRLKRQAGEGAAPGEWNASYSRQPAFRTLRRERPYFGNRSEPSQGTG